MLRKSAMKQAWAGLLLAVFTCGADLPSNELVGINVVYADDSEDDDLLLFVPAILAARPWLDVSTPNGGEALIAGTWYDITWQASRRFKTVDIQLSLNSGKTYPISLAKGTPNDGSYQWGPVPFHDPGKLRSTFRIRIRDSATPSTVLDESDGDFSIREASKPMLLDRLEKMNTALKNDPDGVEKDSDGDGLYDNMEIYLGTDPLHWDTDRDGSGDYREVFGDVSDVPVPNGDGDGKIAALDNDDDDNGENDGRSLDSDGDGIPDYLETYGFVYDSTGPLGYYPWDGDIKKAYYKTDPRQSSTDQDQYSDSMEVTRINMDATVASPGDKPMVAAFPNFKVDLIDYELTLLGTITETNGTEHTDASSWDKSIETSTSVSHERHWEFGTEAGLSFSKVLGLDVKANVSYGGSSSNTYTSGAARSVGGDLSNATQWSQAKTTAEGAAAEINLRLQIQNVGTCVARNVRTELTLQIGGKDIETLTHPPAGSDPIPRLTAGETYEAVSKSIELSLEELAALRTGALVRIKIGYIEAEVVRRKQDGGYEKVDDWGLYFAAAKSKSAHLFLDLGDGNTTEHLVYAGEAAWEPKVTLRDALIWAANGYETAKVPFVKFYQPDGTLGEPKSLDNWYFSLDQGTYGGIENYIKNPDFNFFDTVLTPGSVVVAKAPPINPTPKIHWALLSPLGKEVTAYVDDYFFSQSNLTVRYIDKDGRSWPMTWDPDKLHFSCDCPNNYVEDGTERIVAQNPLRNNLSDPNRLKYKTEMKASEMEYMGIVGFYDTPGNAYRVFVKGNYAYVADGNFGLQVIDISNPKSPTLKGSCDTPGSALGVFVRGDYAYVADHSAGLQVINISDPSKPEIKGSYKHDDIEFYAWDVFVEGSYAYVAGWATGLHVVDVSDPTNPVKKSIYNTPNAAFGVFVQGDYAYVADWDSLQVINITNPQNPTFKGASDPLHQAQALYVKGNYAYVTDYDYGLRVIDISNPESPKLKGTCDTPGLARGVCVYGSYAYVADWDSLQVIDISNPESPRIAFTCDTPVPGASYGSFRFGDYIYEARLGGGLNVIAFR